MGITLQWDDDTKTILRFTIEGNWTWDDYYKAVYEVIAQVKAVDHNVQVIVTGGMKLPSGSALAQLNRIAQILPPNIEKIYLVTTNSFVRALNTIMMKVNKKVQRQLVMVDTVEAAYALVHQSNAQHE